MAKERKEGCGDWIAGTILFGFFIDKGAGALYALQKGLDYTCFFLLLSFVFHFSSKGKCGFGGLDGKLHFSAVDSRNETEEGEEERWMRIIMRVCWVVSTGRRCWGRVELLVVGLFFLFFFFFVCCCFFFFSFRFVVGW